MSVIFFIFCLLPLTVPAQKNTLGKIKFESDAGVDVHYDGISGRDQNRPKWIRTVYFKPGLHIPGLPKIQFLFKLSSLESIARQPYNRFNVLLTPKWGDFVLGDGYPTLSKYTLNGVRVRGVSFDINPGYFRFAFAAGRTKRAVEPGQYPYQLYQFGNFEQNIYAAKIGIGKKNADQFNFNILRARDDSTSLEAASLKKPRENVVAGIDGFLRLFDGKITLKGEAAASAYNRNTTSRKLELPAGVPSQTSWLFQPRASSQYDGAMEAEVKYADKGRSLQLSLTRVGPGFFSLGTPYLHNDFKRTEARASWRFFRNILYVNGGLKREHDNLAGLKKSTNTITYGHLNSQLTPRKLPFAGFGFQYHNQKNNDRVFPINNLLQTLTGGIGYRYRFLQTSQTVQVNATHTWFRNKGNPESSLKNYDKQLVRLSLNILIKRQYTMFGNVGSMRTLYKTAARKDQRKLYNLGATASFFRKKLLFSASFNHDEGKADFLQRIYDPNNTLYFLHFCLQKRTGFRFSAEYKLKKQSVTLLAEKIYYKNSNFSEYNYRELLVRLSLKHHFE
ncbi:hypothetical protein JW935_22490 [candidate division KSB1 bacterium]|nr:hypothetical protein [candidate division KSB1 bacterium]